MTGGIEKGLQGTALPLEAKQKGNPTMMWQDAFNKAKQAYQQRTHKSNLNQANKEPAPAPTWSKFEIRKHNFDNFHSTGRNTAIPVILGRYNVFEPVKTGRRIHHKEYVQLYPFHRIAEDDNIEIWKRFKILNQHDANLYFILRQNADNDFIACMTRYQILKKMGVKTQGANYRHIQQSMSRLFGAQYFIRYMGRYIYEDSLVQRIWGDQHSQAYCAQLSPALDAFLNLDHWTKVNISERLALGRNQLAQSFHLYLSVNRSPENGKWFSWAKDLWSVWGQHYKNKSGFVWEFKRSVIKPLMNMNFIKSAEENRNKSAINFKW